MSDLDNKIKLEEVVRELSRSIKDKAEEINKEDPNYYLFSVVVGFYANEDKSHASASCTISDIREMDINSGYSLIHSATAKIHQGSCEMLHKGLDMLIKKQVDQEIEDLMNTSDSEEAPQETP